MFSSNEPKQSLGERSEGSDDGNESVRSVDEVEETLSYLAKHGGVRNLNALLAAAVPPGSDVTILGNFFIFCPPPLFPIMC